MDTKSINPAIFNSYSTGQIPISFLGKGNKAHENEIGDDGHHERKLAEES